MTNTIDLSKFGMTRAELKESLRHYVYFHRRVSDGSVFYIGKGSRNRAWKIDGRKDWWERTVAKHGLEVEIVAIFGTKKFDEKLAHELEIRLISEYRASGARIINITDGGEGATGNEWTDGMRAKASASRKEYLSGPGVLDRQSERIRRTHREPEFRQRASKQFSAYYADPSARQQSSKRARALRAKPFICIENSHRFEALTDAVLWLHWQGHTKAQESLVSAALNGRSKTCYGYHFRRIDGAA